METPAQKSCVLFWMSVHYISVVHGLVHNMQLRTIWGHRAPFWKCNSKGIVGELGRAAGICGELWRANSSLWEFLVSRWLRMKSKEHAWTCHVPVSDFRGLHDFFAETALGKNVF